ncbi:hypothetical protein DFR44_1412 [Hydromonas duriensis]|uniref:DUF4410 domain-containing protein n=2 Tax=Hydromonas duriensis TaxID=1527608 RepID=A0A4R6Y0H8_9BURK|nr:hypothetical protein DFR44_1412 [Hydromonas duriensis]
MTIQSKMRNPLSKISIACALIFSMVAQAAPQTAADIKPQVDPIPTLSTEVAPAEQKDTPEPSKKYSPLDIQTNFNIKDKDHTTLRIVSQGSTVGVVATKVGLFALSIFSALNGVPLPVGGTSGFTKEQLVGSVIGDAQDKERIKNPAEAVKNKLKEEFQAYAIQKPELIQATLTTPITIAASEPGWRLMYDKLAGSEEQTSQYHLSLGLLMTGTSAGACVYKSSSKSLSEWKANDYQAVVDEQPQIVKECVETFKSAYAKALGVNLSP